MTRTEYDSLVRSRLRPRGRPSKAERGRQVTTWLSAEQRAVIEDAARLTHRPLAQFVSVSALLRADEVLRRPGTDHDRQGREYAPGASRGSQVGSWFLLSDHDRVLRAATRRGYSLSYFIALAAEDAAREVVSAQARKE